MRRPEDIPTAMIKFMDLHQQYLDIKEEIDSAIMDVVSASAFVGGPYVRKFEQQFAEFLGIEHCVGTGNGTDALEIALEALDLPEPSEIIVPGNSFVATAESVCRTGHKVVFCDVDPDTMTLDIQDVRKRITDKTAAIIAVHLYGHPADMDALMALRDEFNLAVIEDCAQAHGASLDGRMTGTIGDIAAFSFYPGKNLGAYGDAGAIVTADEDLALRSRMISNHGRIEKYDHQMVGRNSRLDGLQGAVLSAKLQHLDRWTNQRITVAGWYRDHLEDIDELVLPAVRPGARHVYHLYVVRTERRDALRDWLHERNIETGIHYPVSLPKLTAFAESHPVDPDMVINHIDGTLLSLPMGPHLTKEDVDTVCRAIIDFFQTK